MIRIVSLEEHDPKHVEKFCKVLYQAFGVGTEYSGTVRVPDGFTEPYEAQRLLDALPTVRAFKDDKILYLTTRKLKERQLPSGVAPTHGMAKYKAERALVSMAGLKDLEQSLKPVSRHSLHQLGHLWELHHCLDPRCAMYPPWTPSFPQGEASFCSFCRDKSEQKIRNEKS
jgi:archaemetzincin